MKPKLNQLHRCLATLAMFASVSGHLAASERALYDNFDLLIQTPENATGPEHNRGASAQLFTTGRTGAIASASLIMGSQGSPGGHLSFEIWDNDGGTPGTKVADVGTIDLTTLAPVAGGGETVTFTPEITGLEPETSYFFVTENTSATITGAESTYFQFYTASTAGTGQSANILFRPEPDTWVTFDSYNRWILRITEPATPSTARLHHPALVPSILGGASWGSYLRTDGTGLETLDNFESSEAERITEIRWQGGYFYDSPDFVTTIYTGPAPLPNTETWVIRIYGDVAGKPDDYNFPIYEFSRPASEVTRTSIGDRFSQNGTSDPHYAFSFQLETPIDMPASTPFWVSVVSETTGNPPFFVIDAATSGRGITPADQKAVAADRLASDDCYQRNTPTGGQGYPQGDRAITVVSTPVDDTDADGMSDIWETANALEADRFNAHEDPDSDGLTNLHEFERGTDPNNPDTDADGLFDAIETGTGIYIDENDRGTSPFHADTDADGIPDPREVPSETHGGWSAPGTSPLLADTDRDGLTDAEELEALTNPLRQDTDADGIHDSWEITNGTNPNDAGSPVSVTLQDLGAPRNTWSALQKLPTFDNFGGSLDRSDATFRALIDFQPKLDGEREVVFETGAGRVGHSLVYEAGNKLVLRAAGNIGDGLATVEGTLSDQQLAAGELEIIWSYDVSNGDGTQTIALWIDGKPVGDASEDLGGDWWQPNGASFGIGFTPIAGTGVDASINGIDFTSGTINLGQGLRFFSQLPEITFIEHPSPKIEEFGFNDEGLLELKWSSHPQGRYILEISEDLQTWLDLEDEIEGDGFVTTWTESDLPSARVVRSYYRIIEVE